jgi:hypothetical protein
MDFLDFFYINRIDKCPLHNSCGLFDFFNSNSKKIVIEHHTDSAFGESTTPQIVATGSRRLHSHSIVLSFFTFFFFSVFFFYFIPFCLRVRCFLPCFSPSVPGISCQKFTFNQET